MDAADFLSIGIDEWEVCGRKLLEEVRNDSLFYLCRNYVTEQAVLFLCAIHRYNQCILKKL